MTSRVLGSLRHLPAPATSQAAGSGVETELTLHPVTDYISSLSKAKPLYTTQYGEAQRAAIGGWGWINFKLLFSSNFG